MIRLPAHRSSGGPREKLGTDQWGAAFLTTQQRRGIILAAAPTLAVGLAVGYLLARLGLRPVRRIARVERAYGLDPNAPLPPTERP